MTELEARRALSYLDALLRYPTPDAEVRASLEAWAQQLRAYLRSVHVSVTVHIPLPGSADDDEEG